MTSALSDAGANQQSGTADGTDTSAQQGTGSGVGQHYWVVTLTPPAGASTALQQFVLMGQDAIQTSVDLLGRGATELPPVVDDLLQTVTYQDLGTGSASSDYQALLSAIEDRQQTLLSKDSDVMQASITVSAATDSTLKFIEGVVNELQSEFDAITGKLTAAEETALMQQIGVAIDIVNARVTSVYEANNAIAGTSSGATSDPVSATGSTGSDASDTTDGQTTGTSSGSGDSSGLSSIMEMLPMLAMPLMSLAPELLKDLTKAFAPGQQNQNAGNGTAPQQGNGTTPQPGGTQTPAQTPATNPAQPAAVTTPNTRRTSNGAPATPNTPAATGPATPATPAAVATPSTAAQTQN